MLGLLSGCLLCSDFKASRSFFLKKQLTLGSSALSKDFQVILHGFWLERVIQSPPKVRISLESFSFSQNFAFFLKNQPKILPPWFPWSILSQLCFVWKQDHQQTCPMTYESTFQGYKRAPNLQLQLIQLEFLSKLK